ncbi:MAG: hypothetical protein ACI8PZ_006540 [Myxococcota bacterium]|jgi:hypothetical protein
MRALLPLIALLGCTADPGPSTIAPPAPGDIASPRAGLFHALEGVMVPGEVASFQVIGAVPGETVYIVRSFAGVGPGICPGIIGGTCMGIRGAVAVLATGVADGLGEAVITFTVPLGAPIGAELSTQAVAIRGLGGASSALSPARADVVRSANQVLVAPTIVNLGTVPVGCDPAKLVTLRNGGLAPLTITGVRLTTDDFRVKGMPLPLVLGFGETTQVLVQGDVRGGLPYAGDLVIESDDPAGDGVVALFVVGDELAGVCPDQVERSVDAAWGSLDLTLLLDTTGSMGATADAAADAFPGIVTDLAGSLSDLTFGVATFEDYNDAGFGSGVDLPFRLEQAQTDDSDLAQAALDGIEIHSGADLPESTHEALYQLLTGAGYDQDCDGAFDAADDVRPFIPGPEDAFGGDIPGVFDAAVPGTGDIGGVGLRDGALHVVAYATDAVLRDPFIGDPSPGGCAFDADSPAVIDAANALGVKLIGIDSAALSDAPVPQMEVLADATGSLTDLDGDGVLEPAIVTFDGDSALLRDDLVAQIEALLPPEGDFDGTLELMPTIDPLGLVASVEPASIEGATYGESLGFTVSAAGVWVSAAGPGVSTVELALFHDGDRLGSVTLHAVPPIP